MKKWVISIINNEIFLTVLLALLLGMFLGVLYNSKFMLPIKIKVFDIYTKINPDSQKDSKTLIIEKVTKDTVDIPDKNIFDTPTKRDNFFILFIKRILRKNTPQKLDINNYVLNQ